MQLLNRFIQAGGAFLDRKILAVFLLGISSGFPLTIALSLTSAWFTDFDVSKTDIGLFTLVALPYSLKVFWSPIIDGVRLGKFAKIFGHRRSWLVVFQALIAITILFLATLDPSKELFMIAVIAVILTTVSASQDIVIDAYRIEILEKEEQGHGATAITFGYRAGNLLTAWAGLRLADALDWTVAISVMGLLVIPGLIAVLWIGEPKASEEKVKADHGPLKLKSFIYENIYMPFREFMTRPGWYYILLFIVTLKLGDAMADMMMTPFQLELGFSKTEIADYSKAVGSFALFAGIGFGPMLYFGLGVYRALFVTALMMLLTNLVFIWVYYQGYNIDALVIAVVAEKFSTGLGAAVTVAYMSSLCNVAFTATQYALLSAVAGLGGKLLGSSSGFIVDSWGWVHFFITSTILAVPGIVFLYLLWRVQPETAPAKHAGSGADTFD